MYTLTIIQNYIQNLLVLFGQNRVNNSNIRQKLGKIDKTAVHRICCSMTNTYITHIWTILTVIDINYTNIHTFFYFSPASIFNGGILEHMNFYIPGCTCGD